MFQWIDCLIQGHRWWVAGTDTTVYPRLTVYCIYCHKRAKRQPYLPAALSPGMKEEK